MPNELSDYEPETIEQEDRDHALARIEAEGDPEVMLAHLEKKAALATRMRAAVEKILVSQTYAADWTKHRGPEQTFVCLGSAGAERVGMHFGVKFRDVSCVKESFQDNEGKGYRYVYSGYATLENRRVFVLGSYSTRDKFLGYKNDAWRPLEDINEGSIRNAAFHVFCGNGVKELLGLRKIPEEEFERIMGQLGRSTASTSTVQRGQGTQGGSQASGDDHAHQKELAEICIAIANTGSDVDQNEEGSWYLRPLAEGDDRAPIKVAEEVCIKLSSFEGKDGTVKGKGAKKLTGKWLNATLGKARTLAKQLEDKAPWD